MVSRDMRRALLPLLFVIACDDPASHLYQGRFYLRDRKCLGTAASVDVVEGGDTGTCPPVCLVKQGIDQNTLYVGLSCPPYPPNYDAGGTDPACAEALAAQSRDDTCLADGGSTHP